MILFHRLRVPLQKLEHLDIDFLPLLDPLIGVLEIVEKGCLAVGNVLGLEVLDVDEDGGQHFALFGLDGTVEVLGAVGVGQGLEEGRERQFL